MCDNKQLGSHKNKSLTFQAVLMILDFLFLSIITIWIRNICLKKCRNIVKIREQFLIVIRTLEKENFKNYPENYCS